MTRPGRRLVAASAGRRGGIFPAGEVEILVPARADLGPASARRREADVIQGALQGLVIGLGQQLVDRHGSLAGVRRHSENAFNVRQDALDGLSVGRVAHGGGGNSAPDAPGLRLRR